MNQEIKEYALMLYGEKIPWDDIAVRVERRFGEHYSMEKLRSCIRRSPEYKGKGRCPAPKPEPEEKPQSLKENFEPAVHDMDWDGSRHLAIGLVSDNHLTSRWAQPTYLHYLFDRFAERGVQTVYDCGDITDGECMRKGHEYEIHTHGYDNALAYVGAIYPHRGGMKTYVINGNHDDAFYKAVGTEFGASLSQVRPDIHYLGRSCATVNLTPNCQMELRHPWDGTAYAISYKPQKIVEAMQGGSKPRIVVIGHYHKAGFFFPRNVLTVLAGTTCAQTLWMRAKSIEAQMGGWIFEIDVGKDGTIERFAPEFIPFYKTLVDDYKNFI